MDWKYRFVTGILVSLLLFSCAQVGIINGGSKDITAPRPIGTIPENASTNFTATEITIEFDEYFKLNAPQENIIVLPADLKVEAEVSKRKLILKFLNQPTANTTYQISLNNLVKDFSEGNDSLLQYVFSTGAALDSISYSGRVIDAYTSEPVNQVLLGLYQIGDSIQTKKPLYFTKTDVNGNYKLNYLKTGKYAVYAFLDENKTLTFQNSERAGFKVEDLELARSIEDSVPLLLFPGKKTAKISSKQYVSPRLIRLKAEFPLSADSIFDQGKSIDYKKFFAYSTDSVAVLLENYPTEEAILTVQNQGNLDTIRFRASTKNFLLPEIIPQNKDLSATKSVTFLFSDLIKQVDASLFRVWGKDSISRDYQLSFEENKLHMTFPDTIEHDLIVLLNKNALQFQNDLFSDSLQVNFTIKPERNFGILTVKSVYLPENSLIEVLKDKKVIRMCTAAEIAKDPQIRWLEPGNYSFRIIDDANHNRKWDGGNVIRKIEAENVKQFPETIQVRANWEAEIEFEFKP